MVMKKSRLQMHINILGMSFTTKLCINSVLSDACKKKKKDIKSVMEILKFMQRPSSSDPTVFWKLFDTHIEPILMYAVKIWGSEDVGQIEKVQTCAMERFLGVPLHSSNKLLY